MTVDKNSNIAVLVCLYDLSTGYKRYDNLKLFKKSLKTQNVKPLFLEVAIDDRPFFLPEKECLFQLRTSERLWHKERLINIAIDELPKTIDKIIWLDADIIFKDKDWLAKSNKLLDSFPVIQPMKKVIRLGLDATEPKGDEEEVTTFAHILSTSNKDVLSCGMTVHGHTGYAWGARLDILRETKLFDTCLSGSADHLMSHGFMGDFSSPCISRHLLGASKFRKSFEDWASSVYKRTEGRISALNGVAYHLWHGGQSGGLYINRALTALQADYDPAVDLAESKERLYYLTRSRPTMVAWQDKNFPPQNDVRYLISNSEREHFWNEFEVFDLKSTNTEVRLSLMQKIDYEQTSDRKLNIHELASMVEQDVESGNILALFAIIKKDVQQPRLTGYCTVRKIEVKSNDIAVISETTWLSKQYISTFRSICPKNVKTEVTKESNLVSVLMPRIEKICADSDIDIVIFTQQCFTSLNMPLHAIATTLQTGTFRWKADSYGYYNISANSNSPKEWCRIVFGAKDIAHRKLLHQIERVTADEFLASDINKTQQQSRTN